MGITIKYNMLMMNAARQLKSNTEKKAKTAEKLSSGYRINRAADDAAGLSMSEKMRWMIRGLKQGTENAQDGVSWVQIGDGSLEEAHAILHRMTELAIKASNETNSDLDRAFMQVEFDQLQKELDRLTDATQFNEQNVFAEHEYPYYQIEGATSWPQDMIHTVRPGDNDLVMTYRRKETDPPKTASITVPPGDYTTRELMDEIDTALAQAGIARDGIVFEYTDLGTCNLNLEGGEKIDEVAGGLSYLLFDNDAGGSLGALLGTTRYPTDGSFIEVEDGVNDYLTFKAISADGSEEKNIVIDLDAGKYTKEMLMEIVDAQLRKELDSDNTGKVVEVSHHGDSIKLSSPDYIISEFKGNMFEIDSEIRTGVFYDNVHHSHIKREPAVFMGGCVMYESQPPYNNGDSEKQVFHIKEGVNNLLVLKPNGGEEITIDLTNVDGNGKSLDGCTMRQMAAELDAILQPKGLNVKAYTYPDSTASPPYIWEMDINGRGQQVRYVGLEITSQIEGVDSKVGINKAKSTAYADLFTNKKTTTYRNDAVFGGNDDQPDGNAYLKGLASVSGLEIKAGVNDQFWIQVSSDQKKTITLDAGKYTTAAALAAEIQKKLKDAGYESDVVKVSASGSAIRLDGVKTDVTQIRVGSVSKTGSTDANLGYRDIFEKIDYIPDEESEWNKKNPVITLPEKAKVNPDGTVYIDPAYGLLKVQIDGRWKSVNVSPNNASHTWSSVKELEEHITKALAPEEIDIGCTLSNVQTGQNNSNSVTKGATEKGDEVSDPPDKTYKNQIGYTKLTAGQGSGFKYERNDPATVTFGVGLTVPIEITNENKMFAFTLNNSNKEISIDLSKELGKTKFNSAAEFRDALQSAINKKLNKQPKEYGGIEVSLSGSKLVLKAGLMNGKLEMSGQDDTKISMNTAEGSFIYDLHKTQTPAYTEIKGTNKGVNSTFVTQGAPELKLTLKKPGGTSETIKVNLQADHRYNSITELKNDLNNKLNSKGITVTTTTNGLRFTTDGKGEGYEISVDEKSPALNYLFGFPQEDGSYGMNGDKSTIRRTDQQVKTGFQLKAGDEQKFTIKVDNVSYTVNLDANKTYNTPEEIAEEIQKKVNAKAKKDVIKVSSYGGRLQFETVAKGAGHSISLTYDSNSSMKKIFGTTSAAGAEASVSKDGQLTLKRVGGISETGSIQVVSHDENDNYQGGSFIFEKDIEYTPPETDDGYHSGEHSYMDGADLKLDAGKVDINQWNNELSFYYAEDYRGPGTGTPRQIRITVPPGQYTMSQLQSTLQTAIDAKTGNVRKINVSVDKRGVHIESENAGRSYRIYTKDEMYDQAYRPTGSFYEKILCSGGATTQVLKEYNKDGSQGGDKVFAVGRQDVKNNEVKIQKDGNDTLSLEFSTPDHTGANAYKLNMTLDPGYYKGDALVKQIQKQLDKALQENGLPAGLIEAVIGIANTNVAGAIDDRALAFKLSDKVKVDQDGLYGIEAIGGTAAFSVFYQTEGDIARAYIKGGKDISKGTTVRPDATDFSVDVDGTTYKIDLTPGKYTAEQLAEHMTDLFKAAGCPLRAVEDDGVLKLMHTQYGKHKISNLNGAIKNQLFFVEKGKKVGDGPIGLRLSSISGDRIEIDKPWMNTVSLGINTILISKHKYAQKAISRLKEAVTRASRVRSYFGSMQNRLESTINNNENKAENTMAAESRIRDADFAKEVMENATHNILEQAGVAMMAQSKQASQLALNLLE